MAAAEAPIRGAATGSRGRLVSGMTIACPECGQQIPGDQTFCKYCGAMIEGPVPAGPPPAPAPAPPPGVAERRPPAYGGKLAIATVLAALAVAGLGIAVFKVNQKKPWQPQLFFSASAAQISKGQPCTLAWSAAGVMSLHLNGDIVPATGRREVSPAETTTYRLVAFGPEGKTESREIKVEVIPPSPQPATSPSPPTVTATPSRPNIQFLGDRDHIVRGQALTLTWSVSGATRIEIRPGLGPVEAEGKRKVQPEASTEYVITAEGPGGTASDKFRVRVDEPSQPLPKIVAFQAVPASTNQCEIVVLRWTVEGASRISLDHGLGEVAAEGYKLVRPLRTEPFVLRAEGPGGSISREVRISVSPGNLSSCAK